MNTNIQTSGYCFVFTKKPQHFSPPNVAVFECGRRSRKTQGGCLKLMQYKQEAHGPHRSPEKTVQINKHILLYHNID